MVKATGPGNPSIRYIAASISLAAALLGPVSGDSAERDGGQGGTPPVRFHSPSTGAERVLDTILRRGAADSRLFDFMVGRLGAREKYGKKFGAYFTKPLLDAVSALERKLVDEECDGNYKDDEICGLDWMPLNCAQDFPPIGNWFTTDFRAFGKVEVSVAWNAAGPTYSRYRMVNSDGRWLLDAISCENGMTFNW